MSSANFSIKYNDIDKINKAIQEYGDNAEKEINNYLMDVAKDKFINSITNLIPVSVANKRHAKNSKPLEGKIIGNLTLKISTKSKYYYLYFPQNAEGTSRGKQPNDFMDRGIDVNYNDVVNGLLEKLRWK